MTRKRFPHSDISGSKLVRQLPEAYRSLLRPSSVSNVKASLYVRLSNFLRSQHHTALTCLLAKPVAR